MSHFLYIYILYKFVITHILHGITHNLYVCECIHTTLHSYIHTYIHACVRACVRTYTRTHIRTNIRSIFRPSSLVLHMRCKTAGLQVLPGLDRESRRIPSRLRCSCNCVAGASPGATLAFKVGSSANLTFSAGPSIELFKLALV